MVFDLTDDVSYHTVNDFYKKLFEQIPDLIFQFIIHSDNTYSFPLLSKSIEEIFELTTAYQANDLKFKIYNRILSADRKPFFDSLVKAKKKLEPWNHEFRVSLPQKGVRWLKVNCNSEKLQNGSVSFYGRISDITEAKDYETRLRISEERFQFALDASTVGVWDWDMVTNKVFYSSLSLKILEQDSTDIFDNPEMWDEIVHPDDLEAYYADIHLHFDNKIPYYENYHRVLTSSGHYKWILDRGKVIERDEKGKPLRVIGTHTDISAQKEKELALIKTMDLYSEQNSRLINFSHIVSHNLNTQAGNIKLILDMIEMKNSSFDQNEMLSHLRTISNDLNETIENLTKVVDIQNNMNIEIKELALNCYIQKTISVLKQQITLSNAKIISNISDESRVLFNPAYLESILLNFTTNALRYSVKNRPPVIEFEFEKGKEGFDLLHIKDNGVGIDLECYGDMLFGMYKTFHRHKESRGIGLYITKNQIESMKGKVTVSSKVGVGSTFTVYFKNTI